MRRLIATLALAAIALLAPAAIAAAGITPISPKKGDTVAAGGAARFKMHYSGKGPIYVHVCKSRRKDNEGVICHGATIGKARKVTRSRAVYKDKFYDFPEFWLNQPGTYYWQAYRIACENGDLDDCRIEGPVVKFKVA